jgi:hypothetical protein
MPALPKRLLHRPETALFLLVFCAYAYFYQAGGWNQNSRFALVRSVVEKRTSIIVGYHLATGDLACHGPNGACKDKRRADPKLGEHNYCDKAPGSSWLAAPAYAVVHLVWGGDENANPHYLDAAAYVSTVWAVSLPSAFAVVFLYLLLGALNLPRWGRAMAALAYGLGTLAFPYSTLFYGHQLVAALVLIPFAMLVHARRRAPEGLPPRRRTLAIAGFLLGAAVAVEYQAVLAAAPIVIYAARFVRPWSRFGWLILAGAIPGLSLAAYHWVVFGGPLTFPYEFSNQDNRNQGFFMGLGAPSGEALWNILFSSHRGLFYSAPWLLLAVPGAVCLWLRRFRAEVLVCVSVVLLFAWLNGSLVDWRGGWALGARYLIPAIPFLAILAAGVARAPKAREPVNEAAAGQRSRRTPARIAGIRELTVGAAAFWSEWPWLRRAGAAVTLVAIAYSTFMMLVGTAVKPEVPLHYRTVEQRVVVLRAPFGEFLLPNFYDGKLAVNTQSITSAEAQFVAKEFVGTRHAWNLGQLMGLKGLPSLLPLLLLLLACGSWLSWALRAAPAAARIADSRTPQNE